MKQRMEVPIVMIVLIVQLPSISPVGPAKKVHEMRVAPTGGGWTQADSGFRP